MNISSLKLLAVSGASLLILSACAGRGILLPSSPTEIFYKDGRQAYVASCVAANWGACLEKAGAICRESGYAVLEKNISRSHGEEEKELVFACNNSQTAPLPAAK